MDSPGLSYNCGECIQLYLSRISWNKKMSLGLYVVDTADGSGVGRVYFNAS